MKKLVLTFIAAVIITFNSNAQTWENVKDFNSGQVKALATNSNELYVGGDFGIGSSLRKVVKWNGTTWTTLAERNNTGNIHTLTVYNNELYAGGNFSNIGGVTIDKIAKWNGTTWVDVGGINGDVNSLFVHNNELYAGGTFTFAGGVTLKNIAKWNGTEWAAVMGDIQCQHFSAFGSYNNELYVGGSFGDSWQTGIAKWNGSDWTIMKTTNTNRDVAINALTVYNNELYATGRFDAINGTSVKNIAKWNGTDWADVGGGLMASSAEGRSLCVYDNKLYVSGFFQIVGNDSANGIGKWDGTKWSSAGIQGVGYNINSLVVYNEELYIGGVYSSIYYPIIFSGLAKMSGSSTGLTQLKQVSNLNIYPNPVNSVLNIGIKAKQIAIIDITGKTVLTISDLTTNQINVGGLKSGLYFISATDLSGSVYKSKFVKE